MLLFMRVGNHDTKYDPVAKPGSFKVLISWLGGAHVLAP